MIYYKGLIRKLKQYRNVSSRVCSKFYLSSETKICGNDLRPSVCMSLRAICSVSIDLSSTK